MSTNKIYYDDDENPVEIDSDIIKERIKKWNEYSNLDNLDNLDWLKIKVEEDILAYTKTITMFYNNIVKIYTVLDIIVGIFCENPLIYNNKKLYEKIEQILDSLSKFDDKFYRYIYNIHYKIIDQLLFSTIYANVIDNNITLDLGPEYITNKGLWKKIYEKIYNNNELLIIGTKKIMNYNERTCTLHKNYIIELTENKTLPKNEKNFDFSKFVEKKNEYKEYILKLNEVFGGIFVILDFIKETKVLEENEDVTNDLTDYMSLDGLLGLFEECINLIKFKHKIIEDVIEELENMLNDINTKTGTVLEYIYLKNKKKSFDSDNFMKIHRYCFLKNDLRNDLRKILNDTE